MELTERSVSVLLDFLYTGQISLPSDLVFLLEVAKAADCFHLENVLSWVHGLVLANVSEMVAVRRGYHNMTEMALISHIQSQLNIDWPHIRGVANIRHYHHHHHHHHHSDNYNETNNWLTGTVIVT